MKTKKIRYLSLAMALIMILGLVGCGSSSTSSSTTTSSSTSSSESTGDSSSETATQLVSSITMMVNYKATEAPSDDNEVIVAIEEYTGVDLDITWVPQDAYNEKINTLMASQSLPMVVVVRSVSSSGFVNAARSGMFWDLAPYLDQFENLSQIDSTTYTNVQTDGVQYLIPRIRQTARMGLIIRTDWLENLGLEMPTTIDDLTEILYQFTYNDPDGNGVDDTFGVSMSDTELKNDTTYLSVFMGGCNEWQVNEDGSFTIEYETDTFTEVLTLFREWYAAGYINSDFAINDDELTNFTSGRCGVMFLGNLEDANTRMTNLTAIDPDATVDVVQILTDGEDGEIRLMAYQGFNGAIAIPTTAVETEEELLEILAFLDKLGDPEVCDLINYGIEGESYSIGSSGGVTQTTDQETIYGDKYNQIRQITPFYTWTNLQSETLTELGEKIVQLMTEDEVYTVPDPTVPLTSETLTNNSDLTTYIEDAATNYVIGELSLEEYLQCVQDWKDMGGDQIAEEYAEAYAAANG